MRHTLAAIAFLSALALSGCSLLDTDGSEVAFDGAATFTEVEGGAWVLLSDAGETYVPINLPAVYEEEGLPVRVRAVVRDDLVSYLMIGPIIEIEQITRL